MKSHVLSPAELREVARCVAGAREAALQSIHMVAHGAGGLDDIFYLVFSNHSRRALAVYGRTWPFGRVPGFVVGRFMNRRIMRPVNRHVERVGACPGTHKYAQQGVEVLESFLAGFDE